MKSIKELNERLLWESKEKDKEKKDKDEKDEKEDDDKKKKSGLKSKEFRDNLQQYKGRISGTAVLDVNYRELKKKLEDEISGVNWTMPNVKKAFGVITQMIGVQPKDEK